MIDAQNISFAYGKRKVLEKLSLETADGEFTAVLGANGSGKSTLLKVMSGYLKASEGKVLLNGEDIERMSPSALAKRRAVLEQESLLSANYSVSEVVRLGRYAFSPFSGQDAEGERLAEYALKETELEGFENRMYTKLSGGEKRRVQLARALCQIGENPSKKVLFLDEVSAGLDPAHAHAAMAAAKKLAKKGCSVVAVLHDPNLAAEYADKIALLKGRKIFACAAPRQALTKELMEETYSAKCEIIDREDSVFVHFPNPSRYCR